MKILYITEIFPDVKRGIGVWGGGEKQFYEIASRMAQRGFEVTVLSCRFPHQPVKEMINGMKILRVGLTREKGTGGVRKTLFPVLTYIVRTAKMATELRPDIIHCNTYFPVYAGVIAARLTNARLVCTFHDLYGLTGWIKSQKSYVWGVLGHLATLIAVRISYGKIIAVSPQCKRKLISLNVPEDKIIIVPNGVDLRLFDSFSTRKVINQVLYVGRLVNFKHVDWLIHAFVKVLKNVPNARLKIVGDGPERIDLERLVQSLGVQEHVVFTGITPTYESVARYFNESEVFVLPSTVEGEAIVLKEAMAARIPVVAMKVVGSGVLSLVKNEENGFLLKPGQPNLIADKIVQLLHDEKKRAMMGAEGRRLVEKYDWKLIANLTLQVYNSALSAD